MLRAEKRLARRFDVCTTTTRAEWQTLQDYGTGATTDWFPNGVDATFFAPPADGAYEADSICFVGRMDYYPNQQGVFYFCEQVWPKLRALHPELRFTIVGASPPPNVRALAELPGVSVTGSVPDVRPIVSRAAATVAPLAIARGTQNKILESMALGVPVVCSGIAARGVDVVDGEHLLTADSAEEYCAQLSRLVSDAAERRRLSLAGRARVLSHHSWPSSMVRLDGLLDRCVESFRSRRAAS